MPQVSHTALNIADRILDKMKTIPADDRPITKAECAEVARELLRVAATSEPFAWRVRARGAHQQHWMIQTDPKVADYYRQRTADSNGGAYDVEPLFL